jgi:hypothetical protein
MEINTRKGNGGFQSKSRKKIGYTEDINDLFFAQNGSFLPDRRCLLQKV